MMDAYKKSKGNAGLDGIQFQLDLHIVFLLNALYKLKDWKISTENQEVGKYDDLVFEHPDKSVFLQAKFKQHRKINRDQLISNNSKNADFSLPKYFFSYLEIKSEVKEKTVIICTNTNIDQKGLQNVLTCCSIDPDSLLYFEGAEQQKSLITFNENILSDLKANAEIYLETNLQGKDIDKAVISNENIKDFLRNLQFVCNYPSGDKLHDIIRQLLSHLSDSNLWRETSYHEIYRKIEDWFKQRKGEYLTESRAKAMCCEIKSDKYCELLKNYTLSFESNDFNFTNSNRVFYVNTEDGYLLQMLKIFDALRSDKTRKLYVNPDDDIEVQKYVIEAFGMRRYGLLIMVLSNITNETVKMEISNKLKDILKEHQHKKLIIVGDGNNELIQEIGIKDIVYVGFVTFKDITKVSQDRLLRNTNIIFQGRKISLEELLETDDNYTKLLYSKTLEKLVKRKEIKIGQDLIGLDENTALYYIPRTFKRESTQSWSKENAIPEENLFDVKDKVILISDSPGMGKTTVLTKIASHIKEKYSRIWVIRINLSDYATILKTCLRKNKETISITELLNSQETTKLTDKFEESIFFIHGKVILLLDAIDEISPDYTCLILRLLTQCQEATNIRKIFATTRTHMTQNLRDILNVGSFNMLPFTRQNQIQFLTNYWVYNLQLKDTNTTKCVRYAKTLIHKISSWTQSYAYMEDFIAAIPLQVRMVAEIFQENIKRKDSVDWEGCREYLNGNKTEPKLPDKFNITQLFELFIEKKRDIFIDKGNPSGNTAANDALINQFNECIAHHRNLALKCILTKTQYNLFPTYCENNSGCVLKIGIVQGNDENLFFIHRTFAEYFVAECILQELQQNPSVEFQRFLIDAILVRSEFKVICAFFDRSLHNVVDSLPAGIFKNYQSDTCESNLNLIFELAEVGYVTILQLVLKCIDFKIVSSRQINIKDVIFTKKKKRNTLNDLEVAVGEAGVNIRSESGLTPLLYAIREGHVEMVKFLIDQGADVNIDIMKGLTPLHFAAEDGELAIVKCLVKRGANVNDRDKKGRTALHLAVCRGKLDVVGYLVKRGSQINIKDSEGGTVLHRAAERGDVKAVKYIVGQGVDVNDRDNEGRTPLYLAVRYGGLEVVKYLVKHGSNINIKCSDGNTVLHGTAKRGTFDTVKRIMIDVNDREYNGYIPLHLVSHAGGKGIGAVHYLLKSGWHNKIKDSDGHTVSHLQTKKTDINMVTYLTKQGVNVNDRNDKGHTPLHLVARCGKLNVVNYLMRQDADVNIKDNDGRTPFDLAAKEADVSIVRDLQKWGADVNNRDHNGHTPLHLAARYGQLNVVNYLVKHGSNVNIKDNDGHTPLDLARDSDRVDIVKCIEKSEKIIYSRGKQMHK